MLESRVASCGNNLSAGGQLEQPSEVNNSKTATEVKELFIFFVAALFESVCFLPAKPEQANIAKAKRINSHFIFASYEIASFKMSEK